MGDATCSRTGQKADGFATTARLCYLMRDLDVAEGREPPLLADDVQHVANESGDAPTR